MARATTTIQRIEPRCAACGALAGLFGDDQEHAARALGDLHEMRAGDGHHVELARVARTRF